MTQDMTIQTRPINIAIRDAVLFAFADSFGGSCMVAAKLEDQTGLLDEILKIAIKPMILSITTTEALVEHWRMYVEDKQPVVIETLFSLIMRFRFHLTDHDAALDHMAKAMALGKTHTSVQTQADKYLDAYNFGSETTVKDLLKNNPWWFFVCAVQMCRIHEIKMSTVNVIEDEVAGDLTNE